jgi:hypothetical protein
MKRDVGLIRRQHDPPPRCTVVAAKGAALTSASLSVRECKGPAHLPRTPVRLKVRKALGELCHGHLEILSAVEQRLLQ